MMVSSMAGSRGVSKNDLLIQATAVSKKTTKTVFSEAFIFPSALRWRAISSTPPAKSSAFNVMAIRVR